MSGEEKIILKLNLKKTATAIKVVIRYAELTLSLTPGGTFLLSY